jgi:hypothetical protein
MTRVRFAFGLVALACGARGAAAQAAPKDPNEGKVPRGWTMRTDAPTKDTVSFEQMTPGFHVTSGPAAILWAADSVARGDFGVESAIYLFPTGGRDKEGYGVFVGGSALDGAAERYTYFLLRNDGAFLVKRRDGAATKVLVDWTPHTAIKKQAGSDAMQNVLRVAARGDSVAFAVNGVVVKTLPRAAVQPDGVFGLRVNHAVNVHVTKVGRVTP